jgi:hypothetical protein
MRSRPAGRIVVVVALAAAVAARVRTARATSAAQPAGDAQARVLVASLADRDPFVTRLHDELEAIGFAVVVEPAEASKAPAPLDAMARAAFATAAVRTLSSRRGVEVWIDERASGRPMLRHLVVDERNEAVDAPLVVLQTVELLRANLLAPSAPPAPEVRATAPAPPPPAADASVDGGTVRAGLGGWFAPGGVGTLLAIELGATARMRGPFALGVVGVVPLASATVGDAGTRALVSPFAAAAEASIGATSGRLGGTLGLGGGVLVVRAAGRADAPLVPTTKTATSGLVLARGTVTWALFGPLRAGVTAVAGIVASPVELRLAGHDEARVGPFVAAVAGSLEAAW